METVYGTLHKVDNMETQLAVEQSLAHGEEQIMAEASRCTSTIKKGFMINMNPFYISQRMGIGCQTRLFQADALRLSSDESAYLNDSGPPAQPHFDRHQAGR